MTGTKCAARIAVDFHTGVTGGGRVRVRNALFMPLLWATKHNPTIRGFYHRLLANGKPKMVALIAAMRKLLTILNTMVRDGQPWKITPQYS